jgi:hypothetical protein
MCRFLKGVACALLLNMHPALAVDFHPLESQDLAAGSYNFDNFIIPAGVTVTLVGEPKLFSVTATQDILISGTLIHDGDWTLSLNAGGTLVFDGSGPGTPRDPIDVITPRPGELPTGQVFAGTLLNLVEGGDLALLNTTVNPRFDGRLSAAGSIALRGIVPAATLRSGSITTRYWTAFNINDSGNSVTFEQSGAVLDLLLGGRIKGNDLVEVMAGQVSLLPGGDIRIADLMIVDNGMVVAQGGEWLLHVGAPAAVPEPETWALLLAGLGLVGFAARRTRR